MRETLEICVELDSLARETYRQLAAAASNRDLRGTLRDLGDDERVHVSWWEELLHAWDDGLLPDIINDSEEIMRDLERRRAEVAALLPEDLSGMSDRELIAMAARLEFFMISPVFSDLIDLVEPAQAKVRHRAYRNHLRKLTGLIERLEGSDALVGFLARVLDRVSEDNRKLAAQATHDALTGLKNRRSLDEHLSQWLSWSGRYGRPLGILLVDIDNLKAINDASGHDVGDRALTAVAETLERIVRGSDLVARYGGDEFVIVAPERGDEAVQSLAGRIVRAARALTIQSNDGDELTASVSVGSAAVRPLHAPLSPASVLSMADQSLYAAKREGRNRAGETRVLGSTEWPA